MLILICFYLFKEFYGVDQVKHGESAYPIKAWIENQFDDGQNKPIGAVGKSIKKASDNSIMKSDIGKQYMNIWNRKKTEKQKESLPVLDDIDIVDPVETTSDKDGLREEFSSAVILDPANFLR